MSEGVTFNIKNGEIIGFTQTDRSIKEVKIPEGARSINWYCLKGLYCEVLTLPSSFAVLNMYNLIGINNLKVLNVGKNVSIIGCDDRFSIKTLEEINVDIENTHYSSYDGVLYNKSYTNLIRCPEGKKGEVLIKNGVHLIQNWAFYSCSYITTIHFPDSLHTLSKYAFYKCESLETVTFGKELKKTGKCLFRLCKNIKHVEVDKDNPYFVSEDDVIYNNDKSLLLYVAPLKTGYFEIPFSVSDFGEYIFSNSHLSTIKLPSLTELIGLGRYAGLFSECVNLEKIEYEDQKETKIRDIWFGEQITNSSSLQHRLVESFIPSQLSSDYKLYLLSDVCHHCLTKEVDKEWKEEWVKYIKRQRKSLAPIIIEDSENILTLLIKEKALNLESVKLLIEEANKSGKVDASALLLQYENENFTFDDIIKEKEKELKPKNVTQTMILKNQWKYKVVNKEYISLTGYKGEETEIEIPSHIGKYEVKEIDECAFSPMKQGLSYKEKQVRNHITKVFIPDTVTRIDTSAFYLCSYLEVLRLPVNFIMLPCFKCESLLGTCMKFRKLIIPDGSTTIHSHVLRKNISIKHIELPTTIKTIESYAFYQCVNLEDIMMYQGIEEIKEQAFSNCTKLKEVLLPKGIKEIGYRAFASCKNLMCVTLPDSLEKIGKNIFYNCPNVTPRYKEGSLADKYIHSS